MRWASKETRKITCESKLDMLTGTSATGRIKYGWIVDVSPNKDIKVKCEEAFICKDQVHLP